MKKRFYLLTLFILSIEILFCGMNIHSDGEKLKNR